MELEYIIILLLWILGGDIYIESIKGFSNLTGSSYVISDSIGKFSLAFHFIFWPIFCLYYMIKRLSR